MARHWFGGGVSDWFFTVTEGGLPQLSSGESRSVYLTRTGGNPVVDLLDASDGPMSQVTSGDGEAYPLGKVPPFRGPDAIGGVEVTDLWVDDGTGQRTQLVATDLAASVTDLAGRVGTLEGGAADFATAPVWIRRDPSTGVWPDRPATSRWAIWVDTLPQTPSPPAKGGTGYVDGVDMYWGSA